MCFDSLIEGDATDKSVRELVHEEVGSALKDAGIATVTVAALLLAGGVAPGLFAGAVLVTFVAGFLLHQAVLVAGVGLVRWRAAPAEAAPEPTAP